MQNLLPITLFMAVVALLPVKTEARSAEEGNNYGYFTSLDGSASIPTNLDYLNRKLTADILAKGGYRWSRWGLFGQVGYNTWVSLETEKAKSPSVLNIGAGWDINYFEARARTSMAVGPSVYLTDVSKERGTMGFFVDLRPVGFRIPLTKSWLIGFDPIAFTLNAPVLDKIPLLVFKYVTILNLEYTQQTMPEPIGINSKDDGIDVYIGVDFHFSVISDDPERSILADTLGYSLRAGYRLNSEWAVFLHIENNRWFTNELESMELTAGCINAGIGATFSFFNGRGRTSAMLGSSTLMTDTFLLDKGAVGVFFEIRPFGIRWKLAQHLFIVFDPITFAVVAPEPTGNEKLIMKQYRTQLGFEVDL